jgi:hypothetical protein
MVSAGSVGSLICCEIWTCLRHSAQAPPERLVVPRETSGGVAVVVIGASVTRLAECEHAC